MSTVSDNGCVHSQNPASLLDKSSLTRVVMKDLTALIYSPWFSRRLRVACGGSCGGLRSILRVVLEEWYVEGGGWYVGGLGGWYVEGRGGY